MLFADIRGYTRLIETTPGPVVIRLLDGYLNEMIEVIFRHQGTVEQLIGDEIVVLFGVTEDARATRRAAAVRAAARHGGGGQGALDAGGPPTGCPGSTSASGSPPGR